MLLHYRDTRKDVSLSASSPLTCYLATITTLIVSHLYSMASSNALAAAQAFRDRFSYQPRKPSPATKPAVEHSIKNVRRQLRLDHCPPLCIDERHIINCFEAYCCETRDNHSTRGPSTNTDINRQTSYIKEQKLAAICYAQTTFVAQKDGTFLPISKYAAAHNLGITEPILKQWEKTEDQI